MNFATELQSHPLVGRAVTEEGLVEYECDLFPGTADELGVCVYAATAQELEHHVMPLLVSTLNRLDDLLTRLPGHDADLAVVTLWKGRLGLTFWERSINNEFVAIFVPTDSAGAGWQFIGFGDLFSVIS
ncbi:hypothetical protein [Arthrobacter sp. GMC3]|uniref:hypothetical protein n=1 Tax=Arthrobacter sp. GMC3 TaxID=2058894 RepID=UPI000CE2D6E2|nr:hypothetical protein [Arthrobacter sp. GMC3]